MFWEKNQFIKLTPLLFLFLSTLIHAEQAKGSSTPVSLAFPELPKKSAYAAFDVLEGDKISDLLGWVSEPKSKNVCHGHYTEPDFILANPHPASIKDSPFNVTAKKPAFFTQDGTSVLQGDVKFTQSGREITADNVTFYRDDKTGKITSGVLTGDVHFREAGKLIVAKQVSLDFVNKEYQLSDAIYRLITKTPSGFTNTWGRAKHAVRDAVGILTFHDGTYST